jgi:hypothetical protein
MLHAVEKSIEVSHVEHESVPQHHCWELALRYGGADEVDGDAQILCGFGHTQTTRC